MRKLRAIAIFAVGAFALSACGDTVNIGEDGLSQGITVQATGVADVVPDAVRLSLSVSVLAESNEAALSQASTTAELVRSTLKDLDIAEDDIATQNLSVNPEYSYTESEGQRIVGYRASQVFDVLIRNAENAGAVVDALIAVGGANLSVNSTYPVVDDATSGTEEARKDAVEKARAKAQAYAELLGVEIGDLVYLTELSAPSNVSTVAKGDVMAESSATVIDLGMQEVTVTVEVRWETN